MQDFKLPRVYCFAVLSTALLCDEYFSLNFRIVVLCLVVVLFCLFVCLFVVIFIVIYVFSLFALFPLLAHNFLNSSILISADYVFFT